MSEGESSGRPTLSVAMIVRDEARHLERSLGSVTELADEMVVVDTGSTDGSDAMAARLGARVIHAEWQDDFASARNVSLEAVTGDWVLILDADEEIDYMNAARLRRALAGAAPDIRGFVLLVVSQADHSGSGVEVVSRGARLFRNHLGIRFEGALHEQLVLDGRPLAPELVQLDVSIFHFGYSDPLKNQTRAARNLKILRQAAARHSGDPLVEFHLAGAAVTAGHHAEAEELYRGLLARPLHPTLEAQVRWNLALARLIAGQPAEALAEVDRALSSDPDRENTRFLRAQILVAAGRPAEALAEATRLLAGEYRRAAGLCEVSPGKAALHALAAECSLALGDVEAAGRSVEQAAAADPTFAVGILRARIAAATTAVASGRDPRPRPTLTAALIVKNEEMMLPGCLAKLEGMADEIVVVDTGSIDRTREVALEAGARVLEKSWEEDFARARNFSLEAASGDWVLVIDADERPGPGAGDAIRSFIARGEADAAEVTVVSTTPDEDPLTSLSARSVRLFRRLPGVEFTGVVHERVRPSLERLGLVIAGSPIVLEHLGYALTKVSMRAKQERNLRLLRREVERRGGIMDGLLALHLGVALTALGRDREAIPSLMFAVSPAGRLRRELVSHAHSRLAQALLKIHDPEAAARHVREALALVPDDLFARYVEAGCLHAAGDPAAAARALAELAARAGAQVRSGPLLLDLGDMRAAAGDLAGAERAYSEASRHLPGDGRPAARLRALIPCLESSTGRP